MGARNDGTRPVDWLTMIKDHIATSLQVTMDDFESTPFFEKGGPIKARLVFGEQLPQIVEELNLALAA